MSAANDVDPDNGMYKLYGEFDPILGERLFNNINAELEALWRQQHPTFDGKPLPQGLATNQHLAAHALANLAAKGRTVTESDDNDESPATNPGQRNTIDMLVIVDFETLRDGLRRHSVCETSNGTGLNTATARRLACEANIIPVVLSSSGELLELGRRQRLASPAQRRALRILHPTCAFGTCRSLRSLSELLAQGLTTSASDTSHDQLASSFQVPKRFSPRRKRRRVSEANGQHSETVQPPTAEQTKARNADRQRRKPDNN